MARISKPIAATLALALLLSACGAPKGKPIPAQSTTPAAVSKEEKTETGFALPCHPEDGFHPITGTNRLNLTLAPLLYRGLFSVDRNFQAQKELCASYTVSGDGLIWTFWLAPAEFSDGTSLTAQEVAQSLNTARKSQHPCETQWSTAGFVGYSYY